MTCTVSTHRRNMTARADFEPASDCLEPLHVATVILSNTIGRAFTIDSLNNSIDKALRSV